MKSIVGSKNLRMNLVSVIFFAFDFLGIVTREFYILNLSNAINKIFKFWKAHPIFFFEDNRSFQKIRDDMITVKIVKDIRRGYSLGINIHQLLLSFASPGSFFGNHLVDGDANSPYVCFSRINIFWESLWR